MDVNVHITNALPNFAHWYIYNKKDGPFGNYIKSASVESSTIQLPVGRYKIRSMNKEWNWFVTKDFEIKKKDKEIFVILQ